MAKRSKPKIKAIRKPTVAALLILISGILAILSGIGGLSVLTVVSTLISLGNTALFLSGIGSALLTIGAISGILVVISGVMVLNATDVRTIKQWSIIAFIFVLISLAGGGGLIIGFLLGLVGSILGMRYKA